MRWFMPVAVMTVALAAASCGGGSKANVTPTPTFDRGPTLRLGSGDFGENDYRGMVQFLLTNPVQREKCKTFLALSDLDAELKLEEYNKTANPNAPKTATPVPADLVTGGKIIKEVCLKLSTPTPAP